MLLLLQLVLVVLLPPLFQCRLQLVESGLRGFDGTLAKVAEHAGHPFTSSSSSSSSSGLFCRLLLLLSTGRGHVVGVHVVTVRASRLPQLSVRRLRWQVASVGGRGVAAAAPATAPKLGVGVALVRCRSVCRSSGDGRLPLLQPCIATPPFKLSCWHALVAATAEVLVV